MPQRHYDAPQRERERAYQQYVELHEPYFAKIADDGDTPWFADPLKLAALRRAGQPAAATPEDERRALFMRRYRRPAPPAGLAPIKSIRDYQRNTDDTETNRFRSSHPATPGEGTPAQAA